MGIYKYSLKKDGDRLISPNFKAREFKCNDGSDEIRLSPQTVEVLEALRNWFGRPVHINSAYRTAKYNKKIGGASKSRHVVGDAVDFKIPGVPTSAIVSYLEKFYPNHGIGYYPTFVHIDSRGYKSFWKNKGNNVVRSFYKGNEYLNYKKIPQRLSFNSIKKEEEKMTQEQFNSMLNNYLNSIASEPANAEWSKEALDWAVKEGIIHGDAYGNLKMHSFLTREQAVVILHRFYKLMEK